MTPHKSHGRGTFMLDVVVNGVGRIRRATGTTDPAMFRQLSAMIPDLFGRGRLDILEDIRDGIVHPMQVLNAIQRTGLERLPTRDSLVPLQDAVDEWLDEYLAAYPDRERHHRDMGYNVNNLLVTAPTAATVHDVPRILALYKKRCRAKHRTFNITKTNVQRFLRDTVGIQSPVYGAVMAIESYPRQRKREPYLLTVAEAKDTVGRMTKYGDEVWAMLVTGMLPSEYWGRWELKADHIMVFGTKREARWRKVPLVQLITRPRAKNSRQVIDDLHAVLPGMDLKDCRNIFARWCAEAGIIRPNLRAYGGWQPRAMDDLYQWDARFRDVGTDGDKLRAYLGVDNSKRLEVVR